MSAITARARVPLAEHRRYVAAGTFILLGLINIFAFGLAAHPGDAGFAFSLSGTPTLRVPAAPACFVLGGLSIAAGILRALTELSRTGKRIAIAVVLLCFVLALLCWADAANTVGPVNVVDLLQGSVTAAIPIVLGALAGVMCERSGVINISIEGQLIVGAFAAATIASAFGALWLGLVGGSLAGGLLGALLAVFAIKYLVDQIILGVVLNALAIGLTTYFYDRVIVPHSATLDVGAFFTTFKVPVLGDIPFIGPIFFNSTVFLYITYILIIVIQVGLFRTRWGLRVRAVGEHPAAADTVGIRVLWTRYRNVILGGMVAGIGGAYLTVGSTGHFTVGISAGLGYIGLAAMIFGRWTPLGAVAAALLFGFSRHLADVLGLLAVPVDSHILAMAPYLATIVAVAGLVGKVRAPAADGKPYVKA